MMDTQFSFEPDVFSQIAYKKLYQQITYYLRIKNTKIRKANKTQSQRDVAGIKMLILYNKIMVCNLDYVTKTQLKKCEMERCKIC